MPNAFKLLQVGHTYTRADVQKLLNVPPSKRRGDWDTGYHRHADEWFIFANIGTAGRTGHNYRNRWVGPNLEWRGKTTSALGQPAITSLVASEPHMFTRDHDRDPFTYRGKAKAKSTKATVPVTVLWEFP